MSTFSKQVSINAPIKQVWAVLANFGDIAIWNPGVNASKLTSVGEAALGSTRYCQVGKNHLNESITSFKPSQHLGVKITQTDLPFKYGHIDFYLKEVAGLTQVTVTPNYQLKFSLLGALLDKLFVKHQYQKGMLGLLNGLKQHVESSNK